MSVMKSAAFAYQRSNHRLFDVVKITHFVIHALLNGGKNRSVVLFVVQHRM
jgi:hypothetical protein